MTSAFDLAQRYIGIKELAGPSHHPLIQWWLSLCGFDMDTPDEVPWCSAFLNGIAWELRLPRSKSAAARSWLGVGTPIPLDRAERGADVVVFWRGSRDATTGHVGFFAGFQHEDANTVLVLGGNQSDGVRIDAFPVDRILGVRRLESS